MSVKNEIITQNDFHVEYDPEKKVWKAFMMFYVRKPDLDDKRNLLEWGHLRRFKGVGDTKRQAIHKCVNNIVESFKTASRGY